MKKVLSFIVVLIFACAVFFVFTTQAYSFSAEPELLPRVTFIPLPTMLDLIVNIPDPNLRAALHTATGVPPGDNIYRSDLAALTGTLALSGRSIANAEGVQYCSHVTHLFMNDNDLSSLPSNMNKMTSLRYIALSENNFISLPDELYSISTLESVTMRSNPIASVDPGIGWLTLMHTLDLWNCELTSFPTQILSTNIEQLVLNGNDIGSIPPEIFNMCCLKRLYVNDAGLSSLPDTLYDMVWLDVLSVADNSISSISPDISNLATLDSLDLSGNNLEHLPDEVCDITTLKYLFANENRLYDLPDGIGDTNIQELNVYSNRISSLPPSLVDNTSLYLLDVMLNRLTELPSNYDEMTIDFCNLEYNFMDVSPGSPTRSIIDSGALGAVDYERQLTPVSNLAAEPTEDAITLVWDACPDGAKYGSTWEVDGYIVYLHDASLEELAELGPEELTFTHSGLGLDETHEYWVGVNYHVVHPARDVDTVHRGYTEITATTLAEAAPSVTAMPSDTPAVSAAPEKEEEDLMDGEEAQETATGDDADTQKEKDFPLWAVIVISIFGGAAIAAGVFFGIKALMKHLANRPKGGPSSRKTEL